MTRADRYSLISFSSSYKVQFERRRGEVAQNLIWGVLRTLGPQQETRFTAAFEGVRQTLSRGDVADIVVVSGGQPHEGACILPFFRTLLNSVQGIATCTFHTINFSRVPDTAWHVRPVAAATGGQHCEVKNTVHELSQAFLMVSASIRAHRCRSRGQPAQ